jgi:Flp pilus assembly protein TadB
LDEQDHRSTVIVAIGSAMLVVLACWLLRPKPIPRARAAARRRPSNRWVLMAPVGIAAITAPVAGAATLIGVAIWQHAASARRAARSTRQIAAGYPDALDLLVLSIRAGYLPAQATIEISPFLPLPLRSAFVAVDEAMQGGTRFADALQELHARLGPIAQPLVDSLSSADRYGLPLAPVLERLAFDARQQRRREADTTARELPVRLAVPLVLCTLPSFVLLAIVPLLLGALSSLHT